MVDTPLTRDNFVLVGECDVCRGWRRSIYGRVKVCFTHQPIDQFTNKMFQHEIKIRLICDKEYYSIEALDCQLVKNIESATIIDFMT